MPCFSEKKCLCVLELVLGFVWHHWLYLRKRRLRCFVYEGFEYRHTEDIPQGL